MYFFEKYNVLFVRFFSDYCGCFFTVFSTVFRVVIFAVFLNVFRVFFTAVFRTFFSGFKRLYIDVYFEKYSPFLSIVMVVFRRRISPGKSLQKSHFVLLKIAFFRSIWCQKLCCNDTYVHSHFILFTYLK